MNNVTIFQKTHFDRELVGRNRERIELGPRKPHRWMLLLSGWRMMSVCFRSETEGIEQQGRK